LHEEVAVGHAQADAAHLDQGGVLAPDVLRHQTQRKAHEGPGKDRDGQHQALLRGAELQRLGDEGAMAPLMDQMARKAEVQEG
jgi:hypothetical protein